MIKRRFYQLEHADKDEASDSSSSSDSELEAEAIEESEDEEIAEVAEVKVDNESCSTSSGYEGEDSSANEVDLDSSGLPISDDDADADTGNGRQILTDSQLSGRHGSKTLETVSNIQAEKESLPVDIPACILKFKSVFKCRMCPRIVCLNEETLRAHLNSKRHSRSEKLLSEGRLKTMLNSDGEMENQETAAEMNARILALPLGNKKRKNRKSQREQRRKIKKKIGSAENTGKASELTQSPAKKKRKGEN